LLYIVLYPVVSAKKFNKRLLNQSTSVETKKIFGNITKPEACNEFSPNIIWDQVRNILLYNHQHMDFPMQSDQLEQYVPKSLVYSLLWSFAGDAKMKVLTSILEG
jgi:hypothetical protein